MIFLIYIYITCTQLKHTSQAINKQFNINVCCNFISTVFLYILHIYFLINFLRFTKLLIIIPSTHTLLIYIRPELMEWICFHCEMFLWFSLSAVLNVPDKCTLLFLYQNSTSVINQFSMYIHIVVSSFNKYLWNWLTITTLYLQLNV